MFYCIPAVEQKFVLTFIVKPYFDNKDCPGSNIAVMFP